MPAANGRVAITGYGWAVPSGRRQNDDPIFAWIKQNEPNPGLFTGYVERSVLADREKIETFMVAAANAALADAGITAADVDLLLGYASVSDFASPNSLTSVHAQLGLSPTCWAIPVQADFSNYSASLVLADALVSAGRASNVLVVCGANWTQNVNYHTSQCVSAGDGAGACVVGVAHDASQFRVVDYEVNYETTGYGNMFMSGDFVPGEGGGTDYPDTRVFSHPYFHITAAGIDEYKVFGPQAPPQAVATLLARNGLAASAITLVPYQASATLLTAWQMRLGIGDANMLHTLTQFGNMVIANLPVNLAYYAKRITTDYVVLIEMGPEPHTTALLLRRNG